MAYIKSKGLTSNPNNRTLGTTITKDMSQNTGTSTYNGYTFPANCYYFGDWGGDCFDGFGYFTLERVSDGYKVPIPLANANTADGIITSTSFSAFGNTYSLKYGYPVQGIFKVEIELISGTEIDVRLVIGGNFGSDGNEGYDDYTQTFSFSGITYYLKYFRHRDTLGYDPSVYFYFIPQDDNLLSNSSYSYTRSNSSDNAYFYRNFKHGITLYMSKGNDTYQWILDDLQEYSMNYTKSVSDNISLSDLLGFFYRITKSDSIVTNDNALYKFLYYGFGVDKWGINKWGNATTPLSKSDTITVSDSLIREIRLLKTESISLLENISSNLTKLLNNEIINLSDNISIKTLLTFTETINLVDSILRYTNVLNADSISIIESIKKSIFPQNFVDNINLSDGILKQFFTNFNETLNLLDSLIKQIAGLKEENFTLADTLVSKYVNTNLTDVLSILESVSKLIIQGNKDDAISTLDNFLKSITLDRFTDTQNISDNIQNDTQVTKVDTLGFSENFVLNIEKRIADILTISDSLKFNISLLKNDAINISDEITSGFVKILSDVANLNEELIKNNIIGVPKRVFNFGLFNYTSFGGNEVDTENIGILDDVNIFKYYSNLIADIINLAEVLKSSVSKSGNNETPTVSDALGLVVGKGLGDTLGLSEIVLFNINKFFGEVINLTENLVSNFSKIIGNEINSVTENIAKTISLSTFYEFNNVLESINIVLGRLLSSVVSISDSIRFDMKASKQEVLNILEVLGIKIDKPLPADLVGVLDEAWVRAIAQKQSYIMVGDELKEIEKKVIIMNQVFINGVQVPVTNLVIKDTITERVSTCEFIIPDPSPEIIALCKQRAEVRVYLVDEYGNVHYFGGRIKNNPISTDSPITSLLKITAFDYTDYANDIRVVETYTSQKDGTLTDIVKKMWQKYAPFEVDLNSIVPSDKTLSSITFKYDTLFNATEKIAQLLGYHWYVDYNGANGKILKFFPANNTIKNITLSRQNLNIVAGTINFAQQDALYNRIYLFGGKTYSSNYTHTIIANGSDTIYLLPHKPYPPVGSDMVIVKVNGVEKVVDFDYPYWIDGVDVMLNVEGKYIRFNQNTKPASGSVIEVIYSYEYPVTLVLEDSESIRKYGLSEYVVNDEKITDINSGIDYLQSLLEKHANPQWYGSLETTESSLKAGDIIRVSLPHLLIDDLFEIVEVEKSSERNVIRTKLTLNKAENPDEVIAKRLKDFAKRLQELEMKELQENTILQKVNSVKERFKMKDALSIYGNIYYNINERAIVLDGNIRVKHTSGVINKYYEWKQDLYSIDDTNIKSNIGKVNSETSQFNERVFIGITDDFNNVFGIAKFGEKKFVRGLWL